MTPSMTMQRNVCIDTIKQLIETYEDWKLALEKRQHKFVLSLKKHLYDSSKVAADFHYSHAEILSIFSRIERKLIQWDTYQIEKQRQLLLQKKENAKLFALQKKEEERLKQLAKEEAFHKWRLQMEEEARQAAIRVEEARQEAISAKEEASVRNGIRSVLNEIDSEKHKEIVEEVLSQSTDIEVYKVYPFKLAQYIESILRTSSVEQTARALSVSKTYIVQRICGRNKPRKPCERGAIHYLEVVGHLNKKAMEE